MICEGEKITEILTEELCENFIAAAQSATSLIPESTPPELKSILELCLEVDPAKRPNFADICKHFDEPNFQTYFTTK
jgi:serine/threonine protein kinase